MNIVAPVHLQGLVLAVHPTTRGFAWVIFEKPHIPVAWAIVHAGPSRHERLVNRFEKLLERYEPATVVFEAFEGKGTQRSLRIQTLCRLLIGEVEVRGIEKKIFDRDAIKLVFARFGASTRAEIARAIAEHVDAFSHRLPRERKLGDSEDVRQSLFDAAALALTFFAYQGYLD